MGAALGWGALAASSLLIGAVLGLARAWPAKLIGLILAFGAGALISAISFELTEEGTRVGSAASVGVGLAVGALTYFTADSLLERPKPGKAGTGSDDGTALALGAFLDGIPEQFVLGAGLAGGEGISIALLVAIFVSNLPEGIGSASDLRKAGTADRTIVGIFAAVALVCTVFTGLGYAVADSITGDLQGGVNGFAAGALLVMLTDSMIPESRDKAKRSAGLVTVVGFAVATALSTA